MCGFSFLLWADCENPLKCNFTNGCLHQESAIIRKSKVVSTLLELKSFPPLFQNWLHSNLFSNTVTVEKKDLANMWYTCVLFYDGDVIKDISVEMSKNYVWVWLFKLLNKKFSLVDKRKNDCMRVLTFTSANLKIINRRSPTFC